jgi:hypothetical protein
VPGGSQSKTTHERIRIVSEKDGDVSYDGSDFNSDGAPDDED